MEKKIIIFSVITAILLTFSSFGCKKKSAEGSQDNTKPFNVYVDINDKNEQTLIKFLTEEYKKKNPKSKLKINDVLGGEESVTEDINKGSEADVIFTSRNKMVELAQKGLLSDLSQQYEKNKISDKNYNIMSSYGRIGEKYYGIAVMPKTMEIFYNDNALSKLGGSTPNNIASMITMLKVVASNNIKIPIILSENLSVETALTSIAASNRINVAKLDEAFDNKNKYLDLKEMQGIFDDLNVFKKETGITKSSFELGNETTISSLINGTSPIIIASSGYYNKLKDAPVSIVEDVAITSNVKGIMPVIVDSILCMPTNAKNSEEAGKFVKFILGDELQEALVKKGYITGNKKANAELNKLGAKMVKHLSEAADNSMIYSYNLPKKFEGSIASKVDAILADKYNKKEWEEIVNEAYKK